VVIRRLNFPSFQAEFKINSTHGPNREQSDIKGHDTAHLCKGLALEDNQEFLLFTVSLARRYGSGNSRYFAFVSRYNVYNTCPPREDLISNINTLLYMFLFQA
jgi:hypothetical protein